MSAWRTTFELRAEKGKGSWAGFETRAFLAGSTASVEGVRVEKGLI